MTKKPFLEFSEAYSVELQIFGALGMRKNVKLGKDKSREEIRI